MQDQKEKLAAQTAPVSVPASSRIVQQQIASGTHEMSPASQIDHLGSKTTNSVTADSSEASTPKDDIAKEESGLRAVQEASRVELDHLLAETQAANERGWRVVRALVEGSQLRASLAVNACFARFQGELWQRISGEIALTIQNVDVEAETRLAERLDQALAAAKQRQLSIEHDLAEAVGENRKQLNRIWTDARNALQQCRQALQDHLEKQAQKHLGELAKNVNLISNNLQHLGDCLTTELGQRTEEAAQVFQSRIEHILGELVDRNEERIAESIQKRTAELANRAREVVEREMSEFLSHAFQRFSRSSKAQS